jgi:membrane protein DedA with SNARE-associated domain
MSHVVELLQNHGYALVLLAVLVEQVGVPVPAFPVLVVAGALAAEGTLSVPAVLALAIAAALAGDLLWFHLGRRYGERVLAALCRASWTEGDCALRAGRTFARFGLKALLVTRFVPGLAAAAPSMAGLYGYGRLRFAAFDAAGGALWAGLAVTLGYVFHREVDAVLATLQGVGFGVLAAAAGVALAAGAIEVLRRRGRRGRVPCTQC